MQRIYKRKNPEEQPLRWTVSIRIVQEMREEAKSMKVGYSLYLRRVLDALGPEGRRKAFRQAQFTDLQKIALKKTRKRMEIAP